jgi:hypothetical protein
MYFWNMQINFSPEVHPKKCCIQKFPKLATGPSSGEKCKLAAAEDVTFPKLGILLVIY